MVTVQHFESDQATKQIQNRPKSVSESVGVWEKTPKSVEIRIQIQTPSHAKILLLYEHTPPPRQLYPKPNIT